MTTNLLMKKIQAGRNRFDKVTFTGNFDNKLFTDITFNKCIFNECTFSEAYFKGCTFSGCCFLWSVAEKCVFKDCEIIFSRFLKGYFMHTYFGNSLTDVKFLYVSLHSATFEGELAFSSFEHCDTIDIDVTKATEFYVPLHCPSHGEFTAWKRLLGANTIARLKVPAHATRTSATSNKIRVSEAVVEEILTWNKQLRTWYNVDEGRAVHDYKFVYKVGEIVKPDKPFDQNRFEECTSGIHCFLSMDEAIRFVN